MTDLQLKRKRFENALAALVKRLEEDRWVLAAVLIGSLNDETIWRKESLFLWIIEADGVTKRRKSDGEEQRIFRTFAENDINMHAEIIPRGRFKRMVEGSSRTAFRHNFFAQRTLLYAAEESISRWFEEANKLATRDQETALMVAMTWVIGPLKYIRSLLDIKRDWEMARQELLGVAHSLAAIEIILRGEVYEHEIIYKALEYNPQLFAVVYTELLGRQRSDKKLREALAVVERYLEEHWREYLKPLLRYVKKHRRPLPLSELADEFAHTQIYPWHLEMACEWLTDQGIMEKMSMPYKLTKKSRTDVEEPSYQYNGEK